MEIGRTDLDGLATYWAEGPGPAQAWLVFRVGAADETLFTRGITRFAAALAIDRAGSGAAAYGAFVGGTTTAFELNGSGEQVVELLGQIWRGLGTFEPERFESVREREILHAGWRVPDLTDHLLARRFGPRGPGLSGQPEIGLHHLDPEEVLEWRARYFTTANAALTLKNVSPEDVPVPGLPEGEWRPPPARAPEPPELPLWFEDDGDEVAVASIGSGDAATDAFTAAAVRRTRRLLGEDHRVELAPVRLWPGLDHLAIRCSPPSGAAAQARDALVTVLEELASTGPGDDEILARRRELREWRAGQDSIVPRLEFSSHGHVLDPGGVHTDALEEQDVPARVDVVAAARDFVAQAIYRLPADVGMPPKYQHLARWSPEEVEGTAYARTADDPGSLVLAPDGVTVTIGDRRVTVWFDRCEAASRWPDGTLDLYGSDGLGAQIRPQEWAHGDAVVATIAERLHGRIVSMRRPLRGA